MIALGPTPKTETSNFPFPQNRALPNCLFPSTFTNDDVVAAYDQWYANNVTADGAGGHLRVQRSEEVTLEAGSTVSEGIAYGMLIAVYMDDQQLFDELWKYEQQWLDDNGLMHWYINAAGTEVLGAGAASDAEEDMAWALLMAELQWGGQGTLADSYGSIARSMIGKMWDTEVLEGRFLLPGDGWGDANTLNVSYFTPSYYRAFAVATGNDAWNGVVSGSYDALEASLNERSGNANNGLVPAWSGVDGTPNPGAWGMFDTAPTHHQYDSCRTPFRFALDYCFNGEPRSRAYLEKITSFYSAIGAANIHDGYDLNGSPRPQYSDGPNEWCSEEICQSAAFLGPAGVGAMYDSENQQFLDNIYDRIKDNDQLIGGRYYDESWTVIALLMMTGNFLDYTKIEPVN
jgi:endo-1,4-beta-D-glucanase Y